jgi:hypothetical protein
MEIRMPAPKKSLRPKARPKSIYGVEEISTQSPDGLTIEEREKQEKAKKKMYGGKMKKPVAMKSGGKMPKKMGMGGGMGKCRGMGAATRGGNFKMG